MKVINFAETNSVLNQYMAEIRDVQVQSDRMRFRRNIERIGEIMAYEMSKELTYSEKQEQTPLGIAPVSTFDDDVVIATVFRAGLPLHTGFLNVFDRAGNAFVSAYRYYKDKECRTVDVHIEYIATPDLSGKTLLLACYGRKHGTCLEGFPYQGHACQTADCLRHCQPAGSRAFAETLPRRRGFLVVRRYRPGYERAFVYSTGAGRCRRLGIRRQAVISRAVAAVQSEPRHCSLNHKESRINSVCE